MSDEPTVPVQPAVPDSNDGNNRKPLWLRLRSTITGLTSRQRLQLAIAGVLGLIVLVAATLIWYLIFRQPISQLPGLSINIPPKYSFSMTGVERPLGVALDEERERIYVAQSSGTRTVVQFDLEGNKQKELAAPEDGRLHTPAYVAVDEATGDVFVTDRTAGALYEYSADGVMSAIIKPRGVEGWSPLAVSVADDGSLYVTDATQDRQIVWHMKSDGTVLEKVGQDAGLSFANGVLPLPDGRIAVSDSNNSRVVIFSAEGELVDKLARGEADSPLGLPRGLAVGSGDRLYVVDTVNDVVRVYRLKGSDTPEYATSFGFMGNLDGQFLFPNGIAADSHGRIYVADRENNRVQVWINQ